MACPQNFQRCSIPLLACETPTPFQRPFTPFASTDTRTPSLSMSSTAAAARFNRQQQSPLDQKQIGRPKQITPEISSSIKTLSLLDSCLTHIHILRQIHERWLKVQLSEALVSIEGDRQRFHWGPPLVKQDDPVVQRLLKTVALTTGQAGSRLRTRTGDCEGLRRTRSDRSESVGSRLQREAGIGDQGARSEHLSVPVIASE
jgi:hypothetical protein